MSVAGAAHRSEGGDEPGVLGWTWAGSLPRPPCPAFPQQLGCAEGKHGRPRPSFSDGFAESQGAFVSQAAARDAPPAAP